MDIILDMGNVLLEWNKDKILRAVSVSESDYDLLNQALFESNLWLNLDTGTMECEDVVAEAVLKIGKSYTRQVEEIIFNWYHYIEIYTEVFPILTRLKETGNRIFVLSNTSKVFYELLEKNLSPLKDLLNGFVLSCDIKAIKPDRKMFEEILHKYELNPVNCIFLDDVDDNVHMAESLGIKAYQIKQRGDVVDILKQFI